MSPALVMTVHGVLCDDRTGQRLGDMLDPSSIGFFMDVCEHRLETARLKREGISLECLVADALALTDCHNRHMASYTPAVMQGGEEPEMDVPNSPLDYVAVAQTTRPLDDFTESVTMSTAAVIGKKRGGRAAIEAWVTELGAPVDADHPQSLVAQLGVPSAVLLVATLRKLRLKLLREVIEIMKERVAQKIMRVAVGLVVLWGFWSAGRCNQGVDQDGLGEAGMLLTSNCPVALTTYYYAMGSLSF